MSDLLATALGLIFALVVCLLTVQALLGPWLRIRRVPFSSKTEPKQTAARHSQTADTAPVRSA